MKRFVEEYSLKIGMSVRCECGSEKWWTFAASSNIFQLRFSVVARDATYIWLRKHKHTHTHTKKRNNGAREKKPCNTLRRHGNEGMHREWLFVVIISLTIHSMFPQDNLIFFKFSLYGIRSEARLFPLPFFCFKDWFPSSGWKHQWKQTTSFGGFDVPKYLQVFL